MSDKKNTIVYRSNNSGGSWWLTDANWLALEKAGWNVDWVKDQTDRLFMKAGEDRWLGALATSASKEGTDPDALISEWESITGQDSNAEGCNCCGEPHSFTWYDANGKSTYSYVEVVQTARRWG